jgi:hypothetical protein
VGHGLGAAALHVQEARTFSPHRPVRAVPRDVLEKLGEELLRERRRAEGGEGDRRLKSGRPRDNATAVAKYPLPK